ncbi:MAG: hypothetical protein V4613_09555 [Bacteroidota bacterium]
MQQEIINDCLLGGPINPVNLKPITTSLTIEYYQEAVGNVKITIPAYNELLTGDFERYIIAGITRNAFDRKEEPPLIDSTFIRSGYKDYNPPFDFKEKESHLVRYIYEQFGRENRSFDFRQYTDCPIAYAEPNEFIRLVESLKENHWIRIDKTIPLSRSRKHYVGIRMTMNGRQEAEKLIPQIPLIGLVNQEITTGSEIIDERINHAKNLFLKSMSTMDDKRSACEALSHVLEPLRDDLEEFFSTPDVSDFFQIVNRFDIRHNKSSTISFKYEEQLEWVFYTLLNTISTFVKLKKKFKN